MPEKHTKLIGNQNELLCYYSFVVLKSKKKYSNISDFDFFRNNINNNLKLLRPIHVSKWKMVNTEEEVGGNIDIILMVYFDSIIRHWFVGITSENKKNSPFSFICHKARSNSN